MEDELLAHARALRRSMTKEERKLWYSLMKTYPVPFRRQAVFAPYIVDFYAHQARLAIELDGSGHYEPEQMEYDKVRTEFLKNQYGISVLRFTNLEVQQQFQAVCNKIDDSISRKGSPSGEAGTAKP